MVKLVSSTSQRGLREWIIQRLSAIFMALYIVFFVSYLCCHSHLTFAEWHGLFAFLSMKVATILFLLAVLYHAWIGIWTILTDYVKIFVLRCILNSLVLLMLFACFFWGFMILWSV